MTKHNYLLLSCILFSTTPAYAMLTLKSAQHSIRPIMHSINHHVSTHHARYHYTAPEYPQATQEWEKKFKDLNNKIQFSLIRAENLVKKIKKLTPVFHDFNQIKDPRQAFSEVCATMFNEDYIPSEKMYIIDYAVNIKSFSFSKDERESLTILSAMLRDSRYADPLFNDETTILHRSIQKSHADNSTLLDEMLPHIFSDLVDKKDRNNNTALYVAACLKKVSCAQLLLDHGANLHSRNENNKTPLVGAASRCSATTDSCYDIPLKKMMSLLIENGANHHSSKDAYDIIQQHNRLLTASYYPMRYIDYKGLDYYNQEAHRLTQYYFDQDPTE